MCAYLCKNSLYAVVSIAKWDGLLICDTFWGNSFSHVTQSSNQQSCSYQVYKIIMVYKGATCIQWSMAAPIKNEIGMVFFAFPILENYVNRSDVCNVFNRTL